jgi:hypothetical protein
MNEATRYKRRLWLPSHTAKMAVLAGQGFTDDQIGRALGFSGKTVQQRRSLMGIDSCYRQRRSTRDGRCDRRRAVRVP